MKAVILRDDDANALTPPDVLEQLYRPFLDRGMPVHLAAIPEVRTDVRGPDGELEGFLSGELAGRSGTLPIEHNRPLLDYLGHEPTYAILQHGLRHERVDGSHEFDRADGRDIRRRLSRGTQLLREAGLPAPQAFVAPHDSLSRVAMQAVMSSFPAISACYYDLAMVPMAAWPGYLLAKKVRRHPHFKTRQTVCLTHPGCILSHRRDPATMLQQLLDVFSRQRLTVVVSHHWEYFPAGRPDLPFIEVLHALADHLAQTPDIEVIRLDQARSWVL